MRRFRILNIDHVEMERNFILFYLEEFSQALILLDYSPIQENEDIFLALLFVLVFMEMINIGFHYFLKIKFNLLASILKSKIN